MFLLSGAWQPWDAIEMNTIHPVNFDAYKPAHSAFADLDAIQKQQTDMLVLCYPRGCTAVAHASHAMAQTHEPLAVDALHPLKHVC